MHNFSSDLPPLLVAEITQKDHYLKKDPNEIIDCVVNDLLRRKIIKKREQIAVTDIKLVEHTYPIPTVGLEPLKERISGLLEKHNIFLLGRNGRWDYINMDGVITKTEEFFQKFVQL